MNKRKPGYYWVKIKEWAGDEWVIASYSENYGGNWSYRDMNSHGDKSILPTEINETRILMPDETIPENEALNLIFLLAKDYSNNTDFIKYMLEWYKIELRPTK